MKYCTVLKITGTKYSKSISVSLLFVFIMSMSSCYTVSTENIPPDKLENEQNYAITDVLLKNDSLMNLGCCENRYYKNADKSKSYISFPYTDTVYLKDRSQIGYILINSTKKIGYDNIKTVRIMKSGFDLGKTIWASSIYAGAILFLLYIFTSAESRK